jgi:hypothetical protein
MRQVQYLKKVLSALNDSDIPAVAGVLTSDLALDLALHNC